MMRRGASLNDRVLPGRSALEYLLQTENIDLGFLQFLFPLNEGNRLFEFLPQKLQKDDGFHIFKLIYDSNQTKDGLSVPVHWAGAWLDYIAIEIHLDPNFPFFRIRDSEPNDEWLYLLNDREISTRDQPVHRSEAATCWDYLFDVFPNVPNSLVELREFKFPLIPYITLDSNQHIIYILRYLRAIVRYRYEYRSIISQSIGIDNEHNFELFRVAVTRFRARGDERAHMEPFPEQTWRDVLTVSPLDKLPKSCWHQTWIVAEYGYWPSIWRWVSLNMLLISALGLSTYLTTMPTPFLFRLASAGIHAAHSEPPRSVQGQDYYRAYFQLYVPELYIMADNLRSIGNGLVYVFFLAAKLVVGLLTVSFLGIGIYLTRYAAMGMFQIAGVTHWSIAVIVSGIVVAAPGFIFGPLLSIKWWWEWSM
jgi:hypothetical protein